MSDEVSVQPPHGDSAVARVDPYRDHLGRHLGRHRGKKVRIDRRRGPHHDAGQAGLYAPPHQLEGAEPATRLDPGPTRDPLDHVKQHGFVVAFAEGAVQIHHVDPARAGGDEGLRDRGGSSP